MGFLTEKAADTSKQSKSNALAGLKNYYKDNERVIKGLGWAAVLVGALKISAHYMQQQK